MIRKLALVTAATATTLIGSFAMVTPQAQAATPSGTVLADLSVQTAPTNNLSTTLYELRKGDGVMLQCKVHGQTERGNDIWYKIGSTDWVPARYVINNGKVRWCNDGDTAYAKGVTTASLTKREGPSSYDRRVSTLRKGTTVKIVCKVANNKIDGNKLWYYTSDGNWISARYVRNVGKAPGYCR